MSTRTTFLPSPLRFAISCRRLPSYCSASGAARPPVWSSREARGAIQSAQLSRRASEEPRATVAPQDLAPVVLLCNLAESMPLLTTLDPDDLRAVRRIARPSRI